jgi:type IV secretory pathway component VirB8
MLEQQPEIYSETGMNYKSVAKEKEGEKQFSQDVAVIEQSYFDQAVQWYVRKYITEWRRLLYVMICFVILVPTCYKLYKIANIYYKVDKIPFAIYFDDNVSYFANIQPILGKKHESITISLARFMLTRYVLTRESFTRDLLQEENWENMLERVRSLSSRRVLDAFVRYMSVHENPDSPILRYRFSGEKKIRVHRVDFGKYSYKPTNAEVYFEELTEVDNMQSITKKKAVINFDISNIKQRYQGGGRYPLRFMVISYNVENVELN